MTTTNKWIITLSGDYPLNTVKKKITDAGFKIEQALDEIGSITGSGSKTVAEKLRKIPGVADVSPDSDIQLPSPDEPISW